MVRYRSLVLSLNAISIFFLLFLFLACQQSMQVEAFRALEDEQTPALMKGFRISQAYSGPSRHGRGH